MGSSEQSQKDVNAGLGEVQVGVLSLGCRVGCGR